MSTHEELREALADALAYDMRAVDEVLPIVTATVATELRYAARWLCVSTQQPGYRWLMNRAAEWHTEARCAAVFTTDYGDRQCDLSAAHEGFHIRNDATGRPEYHWGNP